MDPASIQWTEWCCTPISMPVTGDLVNSIGQRWISTWGQMQGTAQVQGPHSLLNSRFLPAWREDCAAGLRLDGVGWGGVGYILTVDCFANGNSADKPHLPSFTFIFNYSQLKVSWEMQNPFAYNRSLLELWEMIAIKFSCYYYKYKKYTHVLKIILTREIFEQTSCLPYCSSTSVHWIPRN